MKNKTEKCAGANYEIGNFRPEDAEGVVSLFREVYGEGYPIRLFYNPDDIVKANRDGAYYTGVARAGGKIVGVCHLCCSAPWKSLYESCAGLVLKEHRNAGIIKEIMSYQFEEFVPQMPGIEEVFGEPVCNHPYMQQLVASMSVVETGIEICLMPAAAYDKEKSASGRVATTIVFRCYRPRMHRVYLPGAYERNCRAIYSRLGYEREILVSGEKIPADKKTRAEMTVFEFAGVARIAVHEIGADFSKRISCLEKDALLKNVEVIQVWIDITAPWAGEAVEELRRRGFFFGGVLPRWFDGDGMLMQKLFCPPSFESIVLVSDWSRELLEVIREDWKRAGGAACK